MKKAILPIFVFVIALSGCSSIQSLQEIENLDYKIAGLRNFQIAGIDLSDKTALKDFTIIDAVALTTYAAQKKLNAEFICDIEIRNSAEPSGDDTSYETLFTNFPFEIFLNEKSLIKGDVTEPFGIPLRGKSRILELTVFFNLSDLIKERSFEDIMELAFKLGGKNGSTQHLKIVAQPTFDTPFGPIQYPSKITIVDNKFN